MDKETDRLKILLELLPLVPFDGWSEGALKGACAAAGYQAADVVRIFPGGVGQALEAFAGWADAEMLKQYEAQGAPAKIRERIALLVRLRLQVMLPYREAVRRASALYLLPVYMPQGVRAVARMADAMWHAAGDNSADMNWYSKRMLLAGVWASTLSVWLRDDSPAQADTQAFLDRRIEDVMRIEKWKGLLLSRMGQARQGQAAP